MKSTLLVLVLMSLVSCVSKSEEKSCTINGVPCKEVEIHGNGSGHELREAVLQVSVKSMANISHSEIQLLENNHEFKGYTVNGENKLCEAKTDNSTYITYRVSAGNLTVMTEERDGSVKIKYYDRVEGYGNRIEGTWINRATLPDRIEATTLEITPNEVQIKVECRYQKEG